ncbi:tRNA-dihydrouridine(20/20a) synthase [Nymphon striatum]|nr:tRNA-dihydrouridine(20/20a) synthase [Nymphon striatum]
MMDWTDRHCRFFHRQLSQFSLLYTEMVVADAAIHGPRNRLLGFNDCEHPVALQLGGSDPAKLAEAARICADFGYDEINLNVGCPSDRVQSGTFGACLMRQPDLVARCVASMKAVVDVPVTVKCRIGVDEQDTGPALDELAKAVWGEGCDALWVHARKAWLDGLSPKENRDVPPLDYGRVHRLKTENPNQFIGLNGGIENVNHGLQSLGDVTLLDGIMLGRAAYQNPLCLADVDHKIYGKPVRQFDPNALMEVMCDYIDRQIQNDPGVRVNHITRHMVGLFHGVAGARRFRQILSMESVKTGATSQVVRDAFSAIEVARAGIVAGFLAGVFGIGGGAILVPVFFQAFDWAGADDAVRMHLAVGTSLAIIVPTSLRSFSSHYKHGAVAMDVLRSYVITIPLGVLLGSMLIASISSSALRVVFAFIAIAVAAKLILQRDSWKLGDEIPTGLTRIVAGTGIGFLSMLMGIGGGVLNNTFMTLYGRPMHQAVATSAGAGVLISVPGLIGAAWAGWGVDGLLPFSTGYVNWIAFAIVIPITIFMAPIGASFAHKIEKRQLELCFGLFLLVVAGRFFYSVI